MFTPGPGEDHDDPLPRRLVVVRARRELGRELRTLVGRHPGDLHVAARGDRADPVLGLADLAPHQQRREEHREALDAHAQPLGRHEVAELVQQHEHHDAEDRPDPAHPRHFGRAPASRPGAWVAASRSWRRGAAQQQAHAARAGAPRAERREREIAHPHGVTFGGLLGPLRGLDAALEVRPGRPASRQLAPRPGAGSLGPCLSPSARRSVHRAMLAEPPFSRRAPRSRPRGPRGRRCRATRTTRPTVAGQRSSVASITSAIARNGIRPARNAWTAISFAAFRMHGAVPPASAALRASARHGNVASSTGSKLSVPSVARSSGRTPVSAALAAAQRVADRDPHVGRPEVREHRAVGERDHDRGSSTGGARRRRCARRARRRGGGPPSPPGPCSSASPSRS